MQRSDKNLNIKNLLWGYNDNKQLSENYRIFFNNHLKFSTFQLKIEFGQKFEVEERGYKWNLCLIFKLPIF